MRLTEGKVVMVLGVVEAMSFLFKVESFVLQVSLLKKGFQTTQH
jgi:hypothetical protein